MRTDLHIAGDVVLDWIIHNGEYQAVAGGVGNVARGLEYMGFKPRVTTVYNPQSPIDYMIHLSAHAISDVYHTDIFIRDYDTKTFRRHREFLRSKIFTLHDLDVAVIHKDSCIREFSAHYADVRTTNVKGSCKILRMSSTDPYFDIMSSIKHDIAIITHPDEVSVLTKGEHYGIQYDKVEAVDDIGAGDTFTVGFLDHYYRHESPINLITSIRAGVTLAQQKVQKVGVFFE
jgi:hypothetical protein